MRRAFFIVALFVLTLVGGSKADAELYQYYGVITLCTGTCASFASLDIGTTITGTVQIDTVPSGVFGDSDIVDMEFTIHNPSQPDSGPVGDPLTDNPMYLNTTAATIASNGTAGVTDAGNQLSDGQLLIEILVEPFLNNETYMVFDLSTGNDQLCIFYQLAGCIPGATQALGVEGDFQFIDTDGDSLGDDVDNCIGTPNLDQRDTDGDGYGNACDADLNNDCIVNIVDLGLFKSVMFTSDEDADFNNDQIVDETDLDLVRAAFFGTLQYTAYSGICSGAERGNDHEK